jgi:hypothetical protein
MRQQGRQNLEAGATSEPFWHNKEKKITCEKMHEEWR